MVAESADLGCASSCVPLSPIDRIHVHVSMERPAANRRAVDMAVDCPSTHEPQQCTRAGAVVCRDSGVWQQQECGPVRPGAVLGLLRLGTAATPKPPWLQWRPQIAGLSTNGPTLCARDAPTHHLGEAARTTPHTAAISSTRACTWRTSPRIRVVAGSLNDAQRLQHRVQLLR